MLMRAAGIPARVVTGYQGGTFNRFADYWIVRQSDAHAWDEVWIEGRGWLRVDPTSAIAPARVEHGLAMRPWRRRALDRAAGSARTPWLVDARLRLDALRQMWREQILFFDQSSQQKTARVAAHPGAGRPKTRARAHRRADAGAVLAHLAGAPRTSILRAGNR